MLGAEDTGAHRGSELPALEEETDFSRRLSRDSIPLRLYCDGQDSGDRD